MYALSNATGQSLDKVKQVIGDWAKEHHRLETPDHTLVPFDDYNAAWQGLIRTCIAPGEKKVGVSNKEKGVSRSKLANGIGA